MLSESRSGSSDTQLYALLHDRHRHSAAVRARRYDISLIPPVLVVMTNDPGRPSSFPNISIRGAEVLASCCLATWAPDRLATRSEQVRELSAAAGAGGGSAGRVRRQTTGDEYGDRAGRVGAGRRGARAPSGDRGADTAAELIGPTPTRSSGAAASTSGTRARTPRCSPRRSAATSTPTRTSRSPASSTTCVRATRGRDRRVRRRLNPDPSLLLRSCS